MLTKVVIWTTSFKAEWGHQLTGKNKQTCVWRELNLQQKKVLGVSFQISTKSAEAREREAPSLLQASSKKAEWTQSRHVRGCSGRQSCQEAAGQMAVGVCIRKVGRNLFLCDNIGKSDLLHMLPFPGCLIYLFAKEKCPFLPILMVCSLFTVCDVRVSLRSVDSAQKPSKALNPAFPLKLECLPRSA